ncbi:MAG TPA: glycosyltransferase [Rhodopila sp.]|nr:glycosyltransferase [Rhodopila sp.]
MPSRLVPSSSASASEAATVRLLDGFVDADWYSDHYPDVVAAGIDPVLHFVRFGAAEGRDPNRFFDSAWYLRRYPDVAASGINALLHYLQVGAAELRNPHPRFDAAYYVAEHPEAAANPLLFHLRAGHARGYLTEPPLNICDFLPSSRPALKPARGVTVDVVVPVYRGLEETQRCLETVLADPSAPLGRVIVVEDRSPEPELVAWLRQLAAEHRISLLRNRRNLGFVASVNRGMAEAGENDVVLLNSDTEVPTGWLGRLARQAYASPRIASVSPLSNNATICGYPGDEGGPLPLDQTLQDIDETCRTVNRGRFVDVPTTVGFCMYIRRSALQEVGDFDAERFNQGYGEENDFCLRATAKGWTHRLACDTFVYHKGQVSFGSRRDTLSARAMALILERFPDYEHIIARHVARGMVTPYRFAVTAALFRRSGWPVILMVTHGLGGGVRRHIDNLVARLHGRAHALLLESTERGPTLSVPALPNHPSFSVPAEREDDLLQLLRSMNVSRVHVHHLMGLDIELRGLIRRLNVPFDTTVHDYYAICPQINLLPRRYGLYCGEPDAGDCNACLARSGHWAQDILTWRAQHAWMIQDAARVFCPSMDTLTRLRRYYPDAGLVFAPHEAVPATHWPLQIQKGGSGRLRIAVLGVLADHKGGRNIAAVAALADPRRFEFHLIGGLDGPFPAPEHLNVTGRYEEAELPGLIHAIAPHVIWFPMTLPETYSYTLSSAIESGRPIVATRIGALPERLNKRPFTWLADIQTSPAQWIALFDRIRTELRRGHSGRVPRRTPQPDFYAREYLATSAVRTRTPRKRPRVAIVPERFENGLLTPCAYIRLVQPLCHPAVGADFDVVLRDVHDVLLDDVDVIITQRFAPPDQPSAGRLIAHARACNATLIYDLDDDLLNIPRNHPDAAELRPLASVARAMLKAADMVWVSTQSLCRIVAPLHPDAIVIENRLDERIWAHEPVPEPHWGGPVRILCMGTTSHTHDFALIEPALIRLKADYGDRVQIDVLGMTDGHQLAPGLNRIGPPVQATRSYPRFVQWLTSVPPGWDIGLAPLLDSPFNRCKSPIKALDYAALGMAVLASDVSVYRGSIADGTAGQLVPNDPASWFHALEGLIRNRDLRQSIGSRARETFLRQGTLVGQASLRKEALARSLILPSANTAA